VNEPNSASAEGAGLRLPNERAVSPSASRAPSPSADLLERVADRVRDEQNERAARVVIEVDADTVPFVIPPAGIRDQSDSHLPECFT
jgi:hypothetical protein